MTSDRMYFKLFLGLLVISITIVLPHIVKAQDDIRAATEAMNIQKRNYIETAMELTPVEKEAFSQVYAEYEAGLAAIEKKRVLLAAEFLANHDKLTDAGALDMLDRKLSIDREELAYKQSFVLRFMEILPGRKVLRFYQIENRLSTAATAELYRHIPVIQ